jgi:hypothetical protein
MHDAIRGHSAPVAKAQTVLGDAEGHLIKAESSLEILTMIEFARESGEPVSNGLAAEIVADARAALQAFRAALAARN